MRVYEGFVTEVSEATPASFCVGEEPARPLGVAHWTERRKEKREKQREGSEVSVFHCLTSGLEALVVAPLTLSSSKTKLLSSKSDATSRRT